MSQIIEYTYDGKVQNITEDWLKAFTKAVTVSKMAAIVGFQATSLEDEDDEEHDEMMASFAQCISVLRNVQTCLKNGKVSEALDAFARSDWRDNVWDMMPDELIKSVGLWE